MGWASSMVEELRQLGGAASCPPERTVCCRDSRLIGCLPGCCSGRCRKRLGRGTCRHAHGCCLGSRCASAAAFACSASPPCSAQAKQGGAPRELVCYSSLRVDTWVPASQLALTTLPALPPNNEQTPTAQKELMLARETPLSPHPSTSPACLPAGSSTPWLLQGVMWTAASVSIPHLKRANRVPLRALVSSLH